MGDHRVSQPFKEPIAHSVDNVHFAEFCFIFCTGPYKYDVRRAQLSTGDKLADEAVQLKDSDWPVQDHL